jgi:chemotaxis protein MotB
VQRRSYASDEGWLLSYADLITNLLIFFAMLLAAAEISRPRMQQIAESLSGVEQPESLSSIKDEIDARIESEGLQELIRTGLAADGLRLSLNSGLVFDSGRAEIRVEQRENLDHLMQTIAPYAGKYHFAIEGHTDSTPIVPGGVYATNWDLAADRANAVRSRLENVGVAQDRVRVEGYADTVPLPESELVGLTPEERLARHRRVVVRIH